MIHDGKEDGIDLTENDLVFITNGGCVENSSMGSQNMPATYNTELKPGGGWDMWRKIAAQDPAFGHPDKFCSDPEKTNWMSATVETLDQTASFPISRRSASATRLQARSSPAALSPSRIQTGS